MALIDCPACNSKVSDAAKQCMHCGHPVVRRPGTARIYVFSAVGVILALVGLAFYKANPEFLEYIDIGGFTEQFSTGSTQSLEEDLSASPAVQPRFLTGKALVKELKAYAMRVNRLTPYKPNQLITLQRLIFTERPMALIFEYEMNASHEQQPVDFEAIKPIQMRRYCTDPELLIASYNGVPITWRYYKAGWMFHEHTISRCEQ